MTSREFHLGDILSVTTGLLVSPRLMDAMYDLLSYMTDDTLFTHQLPRACKECAPSLLAQHPQLADVAVPDEFDGPEHVERWLLALVEEHGEYLPVQPLDPAEHTRIDPLDELAMNAPHVQVIPLVFGEEQP